MQKDHHMFMSPQRIIAHLTATYEDIAIKSAWGETAVFYNPGLQRTHGIHVATINDHDGANDTASNLNRDDVFRFAFGLTHTTYEHLFGPRPTRPPRGHSVQTHHDVTQLNQLMPHPVYAWMGWVQILSPDTTQYHNLQPLLAESYVNAQKKYARRTTRINP